MLRLRLVRLSRRLSRSLLEEDEDDDELELEDEEDDDLEPELCDDELLEELFFLENKDIQWKCMKTRWKCGYVKRTC